MCLKVRLVIRDLSVRLTIRWQVADFLFIIIINNDNMEVTNELIRKYFYSKYDEKRYTVKNISLICDMYGDANNDIYVIEYVDNISNSKTLEITVSRRELVEFIKQ